jgi:membrane-anchored glycerophosphoryl diester phosphodiesterase (GDPDase)
MTEPQISVRSLLRETFATTGSLYAPLLIIYSPRFIFLAAFNSFDSRDLATFAFSIIYLLVAGPWWSGAMIFYIYRSLTRNQVTVGEAFNQANRRLLQLIGVSVTYWVQVWVCGLLIIPGLYVAYRLMFSLYATVIDNSSAKDSISSSWALTEWRGWLVFLAPFLIFFVVFVPQPLIVQLISSTGNLLASKLVGNVLGFLAGPLIDVYFVLLYLRLRESAATIE